ncbi:MAG: Lrp/AsnC family transcriptional regulator [Pseudonocardia sp.]
MDRVDRAILEHLQRNGRLSNTELADRVGLTPSPCLRRVRHLEDSGVITGYHAQIDPEAVGRSFRVTVFLDLATQDRATVDRFERRIAAFDEVVQVRRMFGSPDYLIDTAVADLATYERFLTRLMDEPGVAQLNSHFTMKVVKAE